MTGDAPSPSARVGGPWTPRLAGLLALGGTVAGLVLAERPLELLYPVALVGAGLLLARRVRDSPVALAGCAGLALGGVLEALAILRLAGTALAAEVVAIVGFVVFLVGR